MNTYHHHERLQCASCGKYVPLDSYFCSRCGHKIERSHSLLELLDKDYHDPYGTWQVTTDGDVEGRSTRHLGTYQGYLDDIAKALANEAMYDLKFKKVGPVDQLPEPEREPGSVHVQLDIGSKTWDLKSDNRAMLMREVLKDRPVEVAESNYYASVKLVF